MTENEALEELKTFPANCLDFKENQALHVATKALEEIQQYRALEEKLNGISVEQVVNGFISTVEKETQEGYERGRILTNKEADEWNELQAIGTIEEFKALKEKSVAKKAEWKFDDFTAKFGNPYHCSNCDEEFGDTYNYCPNCGCDMYAD